MDCAIPAVFVCITSCLIIIRVRCMSFVVVLPAVYCVYYRPFVVVYVALPAMCVLGISPAILCFCITGNVFVSLLGFDWNCIWVVWILFISCSCLTCLSNTFNTSQRLHSLLFDSFAIDWESNNCDSNRLFTPHSNRMPSTWTHTHTSKWRGPLLARTSSDAGLFLSQGALY